MKTPLRIEKWLQELAGQVAGLRQDNDYDRSSIEELTQRREEIERTIIERADVIDNIEAQIITIQRVNDVWREAAADNDAAENLNSLRKKQLDELYENEMKPIDLPEWHRDLLEHLRTQPPMTAAELAKIDNSDIYAVGSALGKLRRRKLIEPVGDDRPRRWAPRAEA